MPLLGMISSIQSQVKQEVVRLFMQVSAMTTGSTRCWPVQRTALNSQQRSRQGY